MRFSTIAARKPKSIIHWVLRRVDTLVEADATEFVVLVMERPGFWNRLEVYFERWEYRSSSPELRLFSDWIAMISMVLRTLRDPSNA